MVTQTFIFEQILSSVSFMFGKGYVFCIYPFPVASFQLNDALVDQWIDFIFLPSLNHHRTNRERDSIKDQSIPIPGTDPIR